MVTLYYKTGQEEGKNGDNWLEKVTNYKYEKEMTKDDKKRKEMSEDEIYRKDGEITCAICARKMRRCGGEA